MEFADSRWSARYFAPAAKCGYRGGLQSFRADGRLSVSYYAVIDPMRLLPGQYFARPDDAGSKDLDALSSSISLHLVAA